MKREKSVLLIIAALAVVLLSVVYTMLMRAPGAGKSDGVSQTNPSDGYSAEPESVIPDGDRMAHAAQIALYSCFDRDINEEPVYPKEYYGSYCADGKLIIYLSSLGGETLSRYNALFRSAGFSDLSFIVYKKRDYRKNITSIIAAYAAPVRYRARRLFVNGRRNCMSPTEYTRTVIIIVSVRLMSV